jgi:hypothetical protein
MILKDKIPPKLINATVTNTNNNKVDEISKNSKHDYKNNQ